MDGVTPPGTGVTEPGLPCEEPVSLQEWTPCHPGDGPGVTCQRMGSPPWGTRVAPSTDVGRGSSTECCARALSSGNGGHREEELWRREHGLGGEVAVQVRIQVGALLWPPGRGAGHVPANAVTRFDDRHTEGPCAVTLALAPNWPCAPTLVPMSTFQGADRVVFPWCTREQSPTTERVTGFPCRSSLSWPPCTPRQGLPCHPDH